MVTVQLNEAGDTVKVSTVTDRTRIRARERTKGVEVKIVEKTDTVYVAISDSLSSSNTKFSNPTKQKNPFVSSLKWICFIILGLIALIITVKVCYHR